MRLRRKTERLKPLERPRLRRRRVPALDDRVHPGGQAPLRRDPRGEQPDRSGGGVARVGEERLAGRLPVGVQLPERRAGIEDLSARLERRGLQDAQRDGANRAHVVGDVLAAEAVPARRGAREYALLVAERYREAVDLQLCDVTGRLLSERAEDAGAPGLRFFPGIRVLEREYRDRVLDGSESLGGLASHATRRRVGGREIRMESLDGGELGHQTVELGVGDLGTRIDVVQPLVPEDLGA